MIGKIKKNAELGKRGCSTFVSTLYVTTHTWNLPNSTSNTTAQVSIVNWVKLATVV